MSGGKETPRQKMIGMMYLVLTALLALNVSNAVLEKFAIIDDTLNKAIMGNNESGGTNDQKLKSILGSKVEDKTNAKDKAQKVRDLTKTTIDYLDALKKQLSSEEGKAIERAELVTNTNNAEEIMINHTNPQIGEGYEKKLVSYVKDLNTIMAIKPAFDKLTRTATDYDEFKDGPHKDKPFLEFAFEGVPTMAAIATISEIESEILGYEAVALDSLKRRVSATVYEVDQMVPMVQADASTLVAGQTYEGNLFVAGSASGVNPEMFFGNSQLKVEDLDIGSGVKVKMGKIKFPVRGAASYGPDGTAKSSFHVKINLPGRAKPLEKDIEYKILKPSPRFSSAASSSLYINCGNEVNVSIPGLTDVSGMELSVPASEGSKVKLGPGKFAIIPTRQRCNVSVLLDGVNVYTEVFTTKDVPVPLPRVLYAGNTPYSDEAGLPAGATLKLEPDLNNPEFVQNNRKDANYFVKSFTLLVRGSPVPVPGGSVNLTQYNLRSGESITITNVKVNRGTYAGGTVDVLGNKMSKVIKIK